MKRKPRAAELGGLKVGDVFTVAGSYAVNPAERSRTGLFDQNRACACDAQPLGIGDAQTFRFRLVCSGCGESWFE